MCVCIISTVCMGSAVESAGDGGELSANISIVTHFSRAVDLGCWAGGHSVVSLGTTDKELECSHKLPPSLWTTRQLCQLSNMTPSLPSNPSPPLILIANPHNNQSLKWSYLVGLALIFVPLWPGPELLNIFSMDNIHPVQQLDILFRLGFDPLTMVSMSWRDVILQQYQQRSS